MIALALALLASVQREDQKTLPRVLFFTHSAGFVHDVVKRSAPDRLAPAEELLTRAAGGRFTVVCSQDCTDISAEKLENFSAVVFMTTSTQEKDLPLPGDGNQELVDWVAKGGAFVGIHCATDTNYNFAPYVAMIGGTFDGHPWHEEITVRVEDRHPVIDGLSNSFAITDEIYQFKNWRRDPVRVLLTLDPASVDTSLGEREDKDYALAWTRDWGEGRVFYIALGHREEVWRNPTFQTLLIEGIAWVIQGPDWPAQPREGTKTLFCARRRSYDLNAPLIPANFSLWKQKDGNEPAWKVVDDAMDVEPGTGDLVTKDSFGDALIHVEFRIPSMPEAQGQGRGNSGVYVQGRYEVQVLDSYGLVSALGDCGALYGKKVPDVNACRRPERWQSYDIEFRAPRFDSGGKKSANARLTVWHNGRLIHDDVEVDGPTAGGLEGPEQPTGPLLLQDHGDPVRYRNVWVLPRP